MSGERLEDDGGLLGGARTSTRCRGRSGVCPASSGGVPGSLAARPSHLARFAGLGGRFWILGSRSCKGRRVARAVAYK